MEWLANTFFRGAEEPSVGMYVGLTIAVVGAGWFVWQRAREGNWGEAALAACVVLGSLIEVFTLAHKGAGARMDRIIVVFELSLTMLLVIEDVRAGGPTSKVWRAARSALRF